MAVRSIAQLKAWFKRGLYPTAAQFADLMDSYFHKGEDRIPISSVEELSDRLNAKYDLSDGEILEEKTDQIRRNLETHESEADYKFSQIDSEFESVKGEIENLHSEDNAIRRDFDAGDAATLQAANEYTDSMGVSIREEIILEGGLALQAAKSYTNERVANIVNSAPETLDTLQELADALGNDPNFATTVSNTIGNKVDKVAGSALMSSADKAKLDGVAAGANAYSHPATHPASMIAEDASRRFITDAERQTWNSKPSGSNATPSANGLMAAGDKAKLDGVAAGANNYTHPSDANTRHVTDAEKAAWNGKADTPGVYCAGHITTTGVKSQYWGRKSFATEKYNNRVGLYKITHNIGHHGYFITANVYTNSESAGGGWVNIVTKQANFIIVATTNSAGVITDQAFNFTICGSD